MVFVAPPFVYMTVSFSHKVFRSAVAGFLIELGAIDLWEFATRWMFAVTLARDRFHEGYLFFMFATANSTGLLISRIGIAIVAGIIIALCCRDNHVSIGVAIAACLDIASRLWVNYELSTYI